MGWQLFLDAKAVLKERKLVYEVTHKKNYINICLVFGLLCTLFV